MQSKEGQQQTDLSQLLSRALGQTDASSSSVRAEWGSASASDFLWRFVPSQGERDAWASPGGASSLCLTLLLFVSKMMWSITIGCDTVHTQKIVELEQYLIVLREKQCTCKYATANEGLLVSTSSSSRERRNYRIAEEYHHFNVSHICQVANQGSLSREQIGLQVKFAHDLQRSNFGSSELQRHTYEKSEWFKSVKEQLTLTNKLSRFLGMRRMSADI